MKLRVCYVFQSQPMFWKLIIGVMFGFFMTCEIRWLLIPGYKDILQCKLMADSFAGSHPSPSKQQPPTRQRIENVKYDIPKKELLLVGVMTANKYLENRAVASYNTWGKNVPGKILYFSSETSNLSLPLPIVALPTVDDSYPPQKKSFLMLKYMYENYGDKFEWFMRADDDVYLRTDKLEAFLRRVNSSKTLFIGQAGRGIQEEFGLLSLEYDENYCMGGPGIIMSHETLAKVAPNVKDCLHNLYTTHEDVEIGRCVQKFAGIPCTWSYEMQLIMYHNSSGRDAFTGKLKSKEVHRAISLHPIKQHNYLYRLHNYMNSLRIEDLMYESVKLRREVRFTEEEVAKRKGKLIPAISYNESPPDAEIDRISLSPSLTKNKPKNETTTVEWDFLTKTLFSTSQLNPRRKLEGALKESVDDIVREVMESINTVSKERGRIIDFKDLLYGYHRVTPLYGSDYVLDLLLIYKKYRGRKMTVPVRRHSYLQRAFSALEMREITCQPGSGRLNACDKLVYNSDLLATGRTFYRELRKQGRRLLDQENARKRRALKEESMDYYADLEKEYPENKMPKQIDIQQQEVKKEYQDPKVEEKQEYSEQKVEKIEKEEMNNESDLLHDEYEEEPLHFTANEEIYFIVPLSGRVPVFERFLKNYETVCLVNNEPVHLVLVLYIDPKDPQSKSATFDLVQTVKDKYSNFKVKIIEPEGAFSRGVALESGANACPDDGLLFLVDVDMSFTTEALERIRLNTIRNNQIYYPIVFSEFDPASVYRQPVSPDHFQISELSGYWRFFGYGIASLYRCDLRLIGGYDTSITGWGKEDVDLFDKAVKSNLTIFRAADPGLSHVFHTIECDSGLEPHQRDMCLNSKANTYVSQKVLAQFLIKDAGFKEFLTKARSEG